MGDRILYAVDQWEPGDPLFVRPKSSGQGCHVRKMAEVINDLDTYLTRGLRRAPGFCPTCEVASSRPTCWSCGKPNALRDLISDAAAASA